jgi:hypothetical protein
MRTGVTRIGLEKVRPWSVERENSMALFGANPGSPGAGTSRLEPRELADGPSSA